MHHFFFYACWFERWHFGFPIGIACSNENNIIGERLALKSAINDHFLQVAKLVGRIELVEENPDLVALFLLVFSDFRVNLLLPLPQSGFVDSCVNIKTEESMFVDDFDQEPDKGCFSDSRLTHDDDREIAVHSLDDQAHFEEVVQGKTVGFYLWWGLFHLL